MNNNSPEHFDTIGHSADHYTHPDNATEEPPQSFRAKGTGLLPFALRVSLWDLFFVADQHRTADSLQNRFLDFGLMLMEWQITRFFRLCVFRQRASVSRHPYRRQ